MSNDDSVTRWLDGLRNDDDDAARTVWQRYFEKLVRLARRKLGALPRREADEEDMALSAMHSLVRGAAAGRFSRLENRDDLWKLLVTITARKVSTQMKRHFAEKRGGGEVRGESVVRRQSDEDAGAGIERILGEEPTPEFAAMMAEQCSELLEQFDNDTLRNVAVWKMEGCTNQEIAEQLGCKRRTVERKLQMIRKLWSE